MFFKNFQTRNVAIGYPENQEAPSKNGVITFIDGLKGEVGALLTLDDIEKGKYFISGKGKVRSLACIKDPIYPNGTRNPFAKENPLAYNHSFNFISDKEKIIQESMNEILKNIENDGFTKHINAEYYIQNHISPEVIEHTLLKYFKKIVMGMLEVVEIPILPLGVTAMNEVVELPDHQKEILGERYKDLDHDFLPGQQEILAYMLQRNRLDPITLSRINLALRRNGDDADYYISQYYRSDFLEKYISEKLLKTNDMTLKLNTNESSFQGMREYF